MGTLLGALILFWIGVYVLFASVALLGATLRFTFLCGGVLLRQAAKIAIWTLMLLGRCMAWAAVQIGHGTYLTLFFGFYFVHECLRGPPEEDSAEASDAEEDEEEAPEEPQRDLYADALALLGLTQGFTQTVLHEAYKAAIKAAHPDLGGSVAQAQAVNTARDLIMRRHGWK